MPENIKSSLFRIDAGIPFFNTLARQNHYQLFFYNALPFEKKPPPGWSE